MAPFRVLTGVDVGQASFAPLSPCSAGFRRRFAGADGDERGLSLQLIEESIQREERDTSRGDGGCDHDGSEHQHATYFGRDAALLYVFT
jgi:hypothetical protein